MTARGILIALAISLVLWLFLWWMVSLAERGFDHAAVETVATDVSLPKFPAPSTTTTLPTTTTTRPAPVARTSPTVRTASASRPAPAVVGSGACGGSDLPPCSVMMRESGGSPTAVNRTGCGGRGCYGKWQFDPVTFIPGCTVAKWNARTCGTYQGYQFANEAPESVQDARARELWAGGRGHAHWGV